MRCPTSTLLLKIAFNLSLGLKEIGVSLAFSLMSKNYSRLGKSVACPVQVCVLVRGGQRHPDKDIAIELMPLRLSGRSGKRLARSSCMKSSTDRPVLVLKWANRRSKSCSS